MSLNQRKRNLFCCWGPGPVLTGWLSLPVHTPSLLSGWILERWTERMTKFPLLVWLTLTQPGSQLHQSDGVHWCPLHPPPPAGTTADTAHKGRGYSILWLPLSLWQWRRLCELPQGSPVSTPDGHTPATAPATSGYQVL